MTCSWDYFLTKWVKTQRYIFSERGAPADILWTIPAFAYSDVLFFNPAWLFNCFVCCWALLLNMTKCSMFAVHCNRALAMIWLGSGCKHLSDLSTQHGALSFSFCIFHFFLARSGHQCDFLAVWFQEIAFEDLKTFRLNGTDCLA